jgi:hypothetical protein
MAWLLFEGVLLGTTGSAAGALADVIVFPQLRRMMATTLPDVLWVARSVSG